LTGKLSVCHLNLGNNYPGKGTVQLRAADSFSFRREKYSTRKISCGMIKSRIMSQEASGRQALRPQEQSGQPERKCFDGEK
jgi:hypothetical protein